MMRTLRLCSLAAAATLLGVAGCKQSLSIERTQTVTPGESWYVTVDAPTSEQKLRVQVTSADAPVSVYVLLEKDVTPATDNEVERGGKPAGTLASEFRKKEITLEVTVPAKESFRVWVMASKRTSVTLKVNSI